MLAQIIGPIQGMNVTVGDQANFSCNVSSNEVLINWTVGGKQYDMCRDQEDSQSICFINENTVFGMISRLNIPDTSILRGDTFTVSCKVSQMINENFLRDPSYESRFNETLTESAVLIIRPPGEL